jgi:hypothetical protein
MGYSFVLGSLNFRNAYRSYVHREVALHLSVLRNLYSQFGARSWTRCQGQIVPRSIGSLAFDTFELLQQSNSDESSFGQRELLANADSWATIKWEIFPTWSTAVPTFRTEFVCIGTP